ncbi:GNAT family N-acetyltransferase [Pararhodospirillum oryzae]|uniref:N-acetyltransferase GCN5 n=1 Tax=Pararhodospirillum oryzae TaxID=478448 RepID=A0A512HAT2_9PROT|nr:GNAT family N-acetyltransferase [Pararhodospirillum oryzae]GEO82545.1 N-acetyltransferase GCN5 [Pararhodospirillum oryzae]
MSSSRAVLRAGGPADAAAIQAIFAHYVVHTTVSLENTPPGVETMRERLALMTAEGYPVLVAEQDGRVVGYAYAGPYHKRPAYRPTVEHSIYLAPDACRGGLGRRLMGDLMEACEQAGFRQMIAVIADARNEASLRFHAGFGFEQAAHLRAVAWKFGRWLDVFFYQRALGAADQAPPAADGPAWPGGPSTFR